MRPYVSAAIAAFAAIFAARAEENCPPVADLSGLLRCAQSSSESVLRANGALQAARARHEVASRILPSNPVFEVGAGRRSAESGASEIDRSVELSQTFEIAGQRDPRIAAADASIRAANAVASAAIRDLQIDVAGAAAEVVRARTLLTIGRDERAAADRLSEVSRARASKGVAAPMETELAAATRIQALRSESANAAAVARAEVELAAVVGADVRLADGAELPRATAEAESPARFEEAAALRAEVVSAREEAFAADAQLGLLRRQRMPDVTVAAGYRYEEFSTVLGGRLSVPLPFFNRNGPEIEEQKTKVRQAESAARQAELRARLGVRSSYSSWQRARDVAAAVSPGFDARLRDDLVALQNAYERGTMPLTQVLASLRETQAARRTLVDARFDVVRASLDLNRAAGLSLCGFGDCK